MEYCLGADDGTAAIWSAPPDTDVNGDGALDAVRLDLDADGRIDDAMADLDGDGIAEFAVLDLDDDDVGDSYFGDDGSGTWTMPAVRGGTGPTAGELRWQGLDGIHHSGAPVVDFDGDGQAADRLFDTDGDGLADRAFTPRSAYADFDGDGRWDVKLVDVDGDGQADSATAL